MKKSPSTGITKINILDAAVDLAEKTVDDIVKDQPISQDYVEFKFSTGKDIGRTYPQVNRIDFEPEINDTFHGLDRLPPSSKFTGTIALKDSAKRTDFLSSHKNGMGFMISKRCFDIIKGFDIGAVKPYNITCIHKDNEFEYVYFAFDNVLKDYIDYPRSVFYTFNLFNQYLRDLSFLSKIEMEEYVKVMTKDKYEKPGFREGKVENGINLKSVYVKEEFQSLNIVTWQTRHYFSKDLANALSGITGVLFKETRRLFK